MNKKFVLPSYSGALIQLDQLLIILFHIRIIMGKDAVEKSGFLLAVKRHGGGLFILNIAIAEKGMLGAAVFPKRALRLPVRGFELACAGKQAADPTDANAGAAVV